MTISMANGTFGDSALVAKKTKGKMVRLAWEAGQETWRVFNSFSVSNPRCFALSTIC